MLRGAATHMVKQPTNTPTTAGANDTFARRLHRAMLEKKLSQSDLARKVWGTIPNKAGYEVARNRDRISVYLRGETKPDQKNLQTIADALGMTVEDLAPESLVSPADRENPPLQMTVLSGHHNKVLLRINMIVPMELGAKVMSLLAEDRDGRKN